MAAGPPRTPSRSQEMALVPAAVSADGCAEPPAPGPPPRMPTADSASGKGKQRHRQCAQHGAGPKHAVAVPRAAARVFTALYEVPWAVYLPVVGQHGLNAHR